MCLVTCCFKQWFVACFFAFRAVSCSADLLIRSCSPFLCCLKHSVRLGDCGKQCPGDPGLPADFVYVFAIVVLVVVAGHLRVVFCLFMVLLGVVDDCEVLLPRSSSFQTGPTGGSAARPVGVVGKSGPGIRSRQQRNLVFGLCELLCCRWC